MAHGAGQQHPAALAGALRDRLRVVAGHKDGRRRLHLLLRQVLLVERHGGRRDEAVDLEQRALREVIALLHNDAHLAARAVGVRVEEGLKARGFASVAAGEARDEHQKRVFAHSLLPGEHDAHAEHGVRPLEELREVLEQPLGVLLVVARH